jgi:hypothetical protein
MWPLETALETAVSNTPEIIGIWREVALADAKLVVHEIKRRGQCIHGCSQPYGNTMCLIGTKSIIVS